MSLREEQCKKVCRILDDVLANRPTERDSLIVAVRKAFKALEESHWIPVTERLPKTDTWRTTYIVTTNNGIVTAMEWENTTVRGKSTSRWIWHDRLSPWKVIVWKPLPELYKEVTT